MDPEGAKRQANRRRVAARFGDPSAGPGLTGAELHALKKLGRIAASSSMNRGHTEFKGGWQARETDLHIRKSERP